MSNRPVRQNEAPIVQPQADLASVHGAGITGPLIKFSDNAVWDSGANKFVDMTNTDHQSPTPRS